MRVPRHFIFTPARPALHATRATIASEVCFRRKPARAARPGQELRRRDHQRGEGVTATTFPQKPMLLRHRFYPLGWRDPIIKLENGGTPCLSDSPQRSSPPC